MVATLPRSIRRGQPRSGLGEENGREWPQKGDFNGQMSFTIASLKMVCSAMLSKNADRPFFH